MDHKTVLNLLLANACPMDYDGEEIRTFELDLHCVMATVKARLISTVGSIQYEIVSMDMD